MDICEKLALDPAEGNAHHNDGPCDYSESTQHIDPPRIHTLHNSRDQNTHHRSVEISQEELPKRIHVPKPKHEPMETIRYCEERLYRLHKDDEMD
jgi:hypothetical protein